MITERKTSLLLIGLAFLGFISIGLPDGLLGVAWPSMRAYFGLPLDALGGLLALYTAGYLLASFSSGGLLARLSVGALLALSCLATGLSLIGYALAMWWWMVMALATLAGLGAGAIDAGLNTFAAIHFSARLVNWLHAFYGIGAFSGPLLMTALLEGGRAWQLGYAIVGVGQLALALCFGLTRRQWSNSDNSETQPAATAKTASRASLFSTLRLPLVWLSVAAFFFYTGIEAAAGAWAYSLLTEARAIPLMTAGLWVSIYWGGLTAGRVVSALLGLALGPVFPSLIATTPARLGARHTANGVGFQIAAAALGQALLPALVGVLAQQFTLEIIGPALFVAAAILFALHEALTAASATTPATPMRTG